MIHGFSISVGSWNNFLLALQLHYWHFKGNSCYIKYPFFFNIIHYISQKLWIKFDQEGSWNFKILPSSKEGNTLLNTLQQQGNCSPVFLEIMVQTQLKGDVHYQIHSLLQGGVALLLPSILMLEWLMQNTWAAMEQGLWALCEAAAPVSLHRECDQDKNVVHQWDLGQFFCSIMHHSLHFKKGRYH